MEETETKSERDKIEEDIRRDTMLTETLLRIYALEEVLVAKNIVTKEEITESFTKAANKLADMIKAVSPTVKA